MKLAIKMMLALCVLCVTAFAQGKHKVAVYMSGKNQTSTQSEIVAFALTDAISESKSFTATERTRDFLNTIKKENYYQSTGAVDESQIAEVGRKSGVHYVCVAELSPFSEAISGAKESLLTARLIDVETATIVGSNYEITILRDDDAILSVSRKLAKELVSNYEKRDKNARRESAAVYFAGGGESSAGRILQQFLVDAVSKSNQYAVSERTNSFLQTLKKEVGHQYESGEVDDDQLAKLGVQAGVKYVIALKIASKVVNIRFIDAKSGDIPISKTGLADFSEVEKMEQSIKNITFSLFYKQGSTFTDPRDGQTYRTVKIGNLVWMAENLKYNENGSKCYGEGGKEEVMKRKEVFLFKGKWECEPFQNYKGYCSQYGRLYSWEMAMKACPSGWHLPDDADFEYLMDGERFRNFKRLKAKSGWGMNSNGGDGNGEDSYGFAALPGGERTPPAAGGLNCSPDGTFKDVGQSGYWWSSDSSRLRIDDRDNTSFDESSKGYLFSVRCVKD
jgi:uncharacterized protein (TIGR02145 family)